MHDLPPPSHTFPPLSPLPHFLAYYFSKESVWRWLELLWAWRMCMHNSSHGAGRQAGSFPSVPLSPFSSFFPWLVYQDSQALHSFMGALYGEALGSRQKGGEVQERGASASVGSAGKRIERWFSNFSHKVSPNAIFYLASTTSFTL